MSQTSKKSYKQQIDAFGIRKETELPDAPVTRNFNVSNSISMGEVMNNPNKNIGPLDQKEI